MKRRDLHDGANDGLRPLQGLDLGAVDSFVGLVRGMGDTAFGGRSLGAALDVWLQMAKDEECKVVMTLSGAMTVAQQGAIIVEMIDRGLVDIIVATGALVSHGSASSIGGIHYAHDPALTDKELFERGYNRVYDTVEQELNLVEFENVVFGLLDSEVPEAGAWSSVEFCRVLGRRLEEVGHTGSLLGTAWRRNVPVFIPAFTDSELGLDFYVWAMGKRQDVDSGKASLDPIPPFNPFLDLREYAGLASSATRLGIFTVGGGVPRNWAQQVAPLFDLANSRIGQEKSVPRFHFGVRICPEPAHFGGLSGCTYSEGISWGKFVPTEEGGAYAEVYADATLVWPLLMKALFEALDGET